MATTANGIVYPDPSDVPARQALEDLALSTDAALTSITQATAYSPSLSNVTIGNGTISGAYVRIGALVFWRAVLLVGSTTSITGAIQIGLPVAAETPVSLSVGSAYLNDASVATSAGRRVWPCPAISGGAMVALQDPTEGSRVNGSIPWTWADGDSIKASGTYIAAA